MQKNPQLLALLKIPPKKGDDLSAAMMLFIEDYKRLVIENKHLKSEVFSLRMELQRATETIISFEDPYKFDIFTLI